MKANSVPRFKIAGFEKTDIAVRLMTDFNQSDNPFSIVKDLSSDFKSLYSASDFNCDSYVAAIVEFLTPEYILKLRGWLRNNRYKAKRQGTDEITSIAVSKGTISSLEAYRKTQSFNGSNDDLIKLALASLVDSE